MRLALDHSKRPRPPGEEVQPPILELLEHVLDHHRATDVAQAIIGQPDDPELALVLATAAHHGLVAVLEDVQRNELPGQGYKVKREEGKLRERRWGHEKSVGAGARRLAPRWAAPTGGQRNLRRCQRRAVSSRL